MQKLFPAWLQCIRWSVCLSVRCTSSRGQAAQLREERPPAFPRACGRGLPSGGRRRHRSLPPGPRAVRRSGPAVPFRTRSVGVRGAAGVPGPQPARARPCRGDSGWSSQSIASGSRGFLVRVLGCPSAQRARLPGTCRQPAGAGLSRSTAASLARSVCRFPRALLRGGVQRVPLCALPERSRLQRPRQRLRVRVPGRVWR